MYKFVEYLNKLENGLYGQLNVGTKVKTKIDIPIWMKFLELTMTLDTWILVISYF